MIICAEGRSHTSMKNSYPSVIQLISVVIAN